MRSLQQFVFAASLALRLAGAQPLPVLRHAQEVRSLPPEEARREYPVVIEGIVTYVDPDWGMLFVQDGTAGIYVTLEGAHRDPTLRTGMRVRVEGSSTPGEFSPCVAKARIAALGAGVLPIPRRLPFERLITGVQDGQWSEVSGVVRSGRIRRGHLVLSVLMPGGRSTVTFQHYPDDWAERLVDSNVTARGVMATRFNTHRQIIGLSMFSPGLDFLRVDAPPYPRPFELPELPIAKLGRFFVNGQWDHRVRLRGVVTGKELDDSFFISDGRDNLYVKTPQSCAVRAGDLVDAVGFAGTENRPTLDEAICREAAKGVAATPVPIKPVLTKSADLLGHDVGVESPYDMALIRIEGQLLETTQGPHATVLVLKAGPDVFTAVMPHTAGEPLKTPALGSYLRLTGVCVTAFNNFQQATSFRVLLRQPRDIEVIRTPSWWNLTRAMWGLGLMVIACFGSLAWASILRRRVASRTQALQCANESLRIANEALLHLSQEDALTGAANRRKFDETVAAEFARAQRTSTSVSLLMIDIDHFKSVNDHWGHQKGDEYLRRAVGMVQSLVRRGSDLVARYGGEEFGVVLPAAGQEAAVAMAEEIRRGIADARLPHPLDCFGGVVTVSIGLVTFDASPATLCSAAEMVAVADSALYQAKVEGRNRTVARRLPEAVSEPRMQVPEAVAAVNAFSGAV